MNHRRISLWISRAASWLSLSLTLCAGCSSVQPSDKTVITAGPNPLSLSHPASAQPNPSLAAKPKDTSVAASVNLSDTRQDRLRDVAGDFERRRDEAQYQAALKSLARRRRQRLPPATRLAARPQPRISTREAPHGGGGAITIGAGIGA